jgi:DNA processing protein
VIGVGRDGPVGLALDATPFVEALGAHEGGPGISEAQALAVLTSVDGLGPATLAGLLSRFGTATELIETASSPAGAEEIADKGDALRSPRAVTKSLALAIVDTVQRAPVILTQIVDAGLDILTTDDPSFPARLLAIELPPHVLFVRGDVSALSGAHAVAVVGTRRASEAGRLTAARIGGAIARAGGVVVSGLATGIDGAAQAAVVSEGGQTVGVLGGGHAHFFPRAHQRLAELIVKHDGAVVSEFAPGVQPSKGTFPRRNRIISGLADATVVVEAGARSGALLTANWALEQGRDCFIVPGSIDSPTAAGCLAYLRDNHDEAKIVAGVPQLLEDLGLIDSAWKAQAGTTNGLTAAALVELGETTRTIASRILAGYRTADELVATTGLPIAGVLAGLTLLEARGLVVGVYGRYRPVGPLAAGAVKRRRRSPAARSRAASQASPVAGRGLPRPY